MPHKKDRHKATFPRQHIVEGKQAPRRYTFELRTDYDQRLWPVPGRVERHGTG